MTLCLICVDIADPWRYRRQADLFLSVYYEKYVVVLLLFFCCCCFVLFFLFFFLINENTMEKIREFID